MDNQLIERAKEYIMTVFRGMADGHDFEHSVRVCRNAMRIASRYPDADLTVVALASLLHDTDDPKLFRTENNANARAFLRSENIPESLAERICGIINGVSFSRNRGRVPETLEGKIVQDADRLDAIGAVGIARTFAYGGRHERSPDLSIRHFHDKLLLLKDLMNTEEAREMAESRHLFMEEFLREYAREKDLDDPMPGPGLELDILPDELTVCRVSDTGAIDMKRDFFFIGKTDEEISLVCRTEETPEQTSAREDGWRGLRVRGILDFSLTGVLSGISRILAEKKIGIFAVSTYNTDYILVKACDLGRAAGALEEAGYRFPSGREGN